MRTATASLPEQGAPVAKSPTFERGSRLGPYELLVPIASGGMGHVWAAVRIGDFGFRRMVAVKMMREELAEDASFRTMFLDEARLASRILNSHVVEVLDLGEDSGTIYQAMAFVDGDSLARLLTHAKEKGQPPMAAPIVARIVSETLRGLHAAHELRGENGEALEFVHRDVSPHNILVGLDGVAKITDFGIAKAVNGSKLDGVASGAKGKIAYMAPEQLRGEVVDRRADLFAVGVVLWELLTGERMSNPGVSVLTGEPIKHPSDVRAGAHRGLGDVALRALRLAREERYRSAEEMADAVERTAHASNLVLSSRSVAAWVSELARDRILQRKHDAEEQLARSKIFSGAPPIPTITAHTVFGKKERIAVGGVVVVLALGLLGWFALRSSGSAVDAEKAPPLASVSVAPPTASSAPVSEPPASPSFEAKTTPSSSAAAVSPTRAHPVIKKGVDAKPPSAPKPKYDDPYR